MSLCLSDVDSQERLRAFLMTDRDEKDCPEGHERLARRRATSVSDTDEDFLWSGLPRRPEDYKSYFSPLRAVGVTAPS